MNMIEYCARCVYRAQCNRDEVECKPQIDDDGHFDGVVITIKNNKNGERK